MPSVEGTNPENSQRNRYTNIFPCTRLPSLPSSPALIPCPYPPDLIPCPDPLPSNPVADDPSRVTLKTLGDFNDNNGYINASYMSVPGVWYRSISTQGPVESTAGHFWQMAYEEESPVIVMLTREIESNRVRGRGQRHRAWALEGAGPGR